MTATINTTSDLASRFVNGILAIKPLANLAKHQARQMMIKRAEKIGVFWTKEVEKLQTRDWGSDLAQVQNPQLNYPDYYVTSFHAYETGNLSWQAAGICRVQSDLEAAVAQILTWQAELAQLAEPSRLWIETRNLADYAYLLMRSALFRIESRGAHFRSDFPDTDPNWQLHTIIEGLKIRRSP